MNPLQELRRLGQSVWLDSIQRSYLEPGGYLSQLIAADEIDGLTSNPSIFEQALGKDPSYEAQMGELKGSDPRAALWALMKADVKGACDQFLPMWQASSGALGYVSIEVDPSRAFDTAGTIADAQQLWDELDRPNLMIKVPGTEPGLAAITEILARGINVNVTLLFSVERYEQVIAAYLAGVRELIARGGDASSVRSVASFFVSRVDSKVDALLGADHPRLATAAIANARLAYGSFLREFSSPAFEELAAAGAHVQRPLWASTSTKNPAYRDVLYVEELAGPDTVNTMPEVTLDAYRDHGITEDRISTTVDDAAALLAQLADDGIDLGQITKELETEGVEKFVQSFDAAVAAVAQHVA